MTLPADYPALLSRLDAWHAEARERYPGVIPCRAGCSACCHGPFDISAADALLIRDAVRALPEDVRFDVRRRALAQIGAMRRLEPALVAPWDISALGEERFDALVEALEEAPCPALDDAGACRVYERRPMICRLMGLGLETPDGHVIENACPIQAEIPEYENLPPQPFDLTGWEVSEAEALIVAGAQFLGADARGGFETTVAGAILLDAPEAYSP